MGDMRNETDLLIYQVEITGSRVIGAPGISRAIARRVDKARLVLLCMGKGCCPTGTAYNGSVQPLAHTREPLRSRVSMIGVPSGRGCLPRKDLGVFRE